MSTTTLTKSRRRDAPGDRLESDEVDLLGDSEAAVASGVKTKRRAGSTHKKNEVIDPIVSGTKSKPEESGSVAKKADAPKRRNAALGKAERVDIKSFREDLDLTLDEFAKLLGSTSRSVSGWERGRPMSPLAERMFHEVKALIGRLSAVADPEHFTEWLRRKNADFEGFSPIDLIQTGKMYRLWELVFRIESGDPM